MKTIIIMSTIVLAASAAHAQPALTDSTEVAPAPHGPDAYTDQMTTTYDSTRAVLVPRLGLDLGGAVRFRPGIELAFGSDGIDGANLTTALAYQW